MSKQQPCQPWLEAGREASRWGWRPQEPGRGSAPASRATYCGGTKRDVAKLEGSEAGQVGPGC